MRISTPLALVALTLTSTLATASDDLFSEVAVESVFASSQPAKPAETQAASTASPSRITGAGQLGELLRSLGYEPERLGEKAVKVSVSHGVWTIPTTLRAAVDRSQVDITMGLASPGKDSELTASKLLKLLSADNGAAFFTYDRSIGQIQLRQTVSARSLGADRLSLLLKEMAELAASREASWYEEPKPETKQQSVSADSLPVGTWLAKPTQGEAFALNLSADGGFSLVHVKGNRSMQSKGKATRNGGALTLAGSDGTRLQTSISGVSDRGFTLTVGDRRLSFAKAS